MPEVKQILYAHLFPVAAATRLTRFSGYALRMLLRVTEPDFTLVECFGGGDACSITPACRLRGELRRALAAFLAHMDACTLEDLQLPPRAFAPVGGVKGGRGARGGGRNTPPAAKARTGFVRIRAQRAPISISAPQGFCVSATLTMKAKVASAAA